MNHPKQNERLELIDVPVAQGSRKPYSPPIITDLEPIGALTGGSTGAFSDLGATSISASKAT